MKLSDFDYELPPELIAHHPAPERTASRLFYYDRASGQKTHARFAGLFDYFRAGDVLVLNDTRVMPARLIGRRKSGGSVEALLLKPLGTTCWKVLIRPSGRIKKGEIIFFEKSGHSLLATVTDDAPPDSGERLLDFGDVDFTREIEQTGFMPLPPYIDRKADETDKERYQTVFAQKGSAIAAPTAGLHFDRPLLARLEKMGVEIVYVTLHVGYGTFQPMMCDNPAEHRMHEEMFEFTPTAAATVNRACREGRRVIACGTTSVRVLETAAVAPGAVEARSGVTNIFIYPPYSFKITSGIVTNFHLPKTTLLMLVAALLGEGGRDKLFDLYHEAMRERYRFFSYGDAMLIL